MTKMNENNNVQDDCNQNSLNFVSQLSSSPTEFVINKKREELNNFNKRLVNYQLCNDLLSTFEDFTNNYDKSEDENSSKVVISVSDFDANEKTLSGGDHLNFYHKSSSQVLANGNDVFERNNLDKNSELIYNYKQEEKKGLIEQSARFSISNSDRKRNLSSFTKGLKVQQLKKGDTPSAESLENSSQVALKPSRKRRLDRIAISNSTNGNISTTPSLPQDYNHNNNNNHVKNERLSPGTPDTSSRSITPSSASHPDTPPSEQPILPPSGRNYSDFMRSLAAKYNNSNPNDYFNAVRNGFPPPLDSRFKPSPFPNVVPNLIPPSNSREESNKKQQDFSSMLNHFASPTLFPPLIDMSSTQTLMALVRTAKEAELQNLLKNNKKQDPSSPLDLSSAAPPMKKPKVRTPSLSNLVRSNPIAKRSQSESPKFHEDVSSWSVDDVCNFISGIDICAEYSKNFRDQQIDGSGLPLLTEEHLTTKMNMKLGPALKLRSILAKKLGSCSICLHCTHCHRNSSSSPDPSNITGNTSDSGGAS